MNKVNFVTIDRDNEVWEVKAEVVELLVKLLRGSSVRLDMGFLNLRRNTFFIEAEFPEREKAARSPEYDGPWSYPYE